MSGIEDAVNSVTRLVGVGIVAGTSMKVINNVNRMAATKPKARRKCSQTRRRKRRR